MNNSFTYLFILIFNPENLPIIKIVEPCLVKVVRMSQLDAYIPSLLYQSKENLENERKIIEDLFAIFDSMMEKLGDSELEDR